MSAASDVADAVDSDALVELVREAVRIPSVTPNEEAFARWVFGRITESKVFSVARNGMHAGIVGAAVAASGANRGAWTSSAS